MQESEKMIKLECERKNYKIKKTHSLKKILLLLHSKLHFLFFSRLLLFPFNGWRVKKLILCYSTCSYFVIFVFFKYIQTFSFSYLFLIHHVRWSHLQKYPSQGTTFNLCHYENVWNKHSIKCFSLLIILFALSFFLSFSLR